jgi:hypothetical protein
VNPHRGVAGVAQNDTFEYWYVIVITAVDQDDVTVVDELVVRRITSAHPAYGPSTETQHVMRRRRAARPADRKAADLAPPPLIPPGRAWPGRRSDHFVPGDGIGGSPRVSSRQCAIRGGRLRPAHGRERCAADFHDGSLRTCYAEPRDVRQTARQPT